MCGMWFWIQQDNSSAPLGTGGAEQKKKTYWPGEESDDQSSAGKAKNSKPVPAGKAKVTADVASFCHSFTHWNFNFLFTARFIY